MNHFVSVYCLIPHSCRLVLFLRCLWIHFYIFLVWFRSFLFLGKGFCKWPLNSTPVKDLWNNHHCSGKEMNKPALPPHSFAVHFGRVLLSHMIIVNVSSWAHIMTPPPLFFPSLGKPTHSDLLFLYRISSRAAVQPARRPPLFGSAVRSPHGRGSEMNPKSRLYPSTLPVTSVLKKRTRTEPELDWEPLL